MKQFYLLLIMGLVASGFVFVAPRLQGWSDIFQTYLKRYNSWRFCVLLSCFDLSVGFANLVWVDEGKPVVLENFIPSVLVILSGVVLFYLFWRRQYPEYKIKHFSWLFKTLDFCVKDSFYLGICCVVVAFVHFFAEGIVLF